MRCSLNCHWMFLDLSLDFHRIFMDLRGSGTSFWKPSGIILGSWGEPKHPWVSQMAPASFFLWISGSPGDPIVETFFVSWVLLGSFGLPLRLSWRLLGLISKLWKAPRQSCGWSWTLLDASWGLLERFWRFLEASWEHLGSVWGLFWNYFDALKESSIRFTEKLKKYEK